MRKDFNRGIMRCARIRLYDADLCAWIGHHEYKRAGFDKACSDAKKYSDWTLHTVFVCVRNHGEYFIKSVVYPVGA